MSSTKRRTRSADQAEFAGMVEEIVRRLAANKPVRRTLAGRGRVHIDRQLPFLCVYRRPADRDDVGTSHLVKSEAAYLIASDRRHNETRKLVREIAASSAAEFGAYLILELWADPDGGKANDPAVPTVLPTFRVVAPPSAELNRTVEALAGRLAKIKILKQGVEVEVQRRDQTHPPGRRPLLAPATARELNCSILGVAVPPVYRDAQSSEQFPIIARHLRRSVGLALRHAEYEFSRSRTTHRPRHYHELGRRAVVKAVWEVDRQLAEVSSSFDYLLQLTPVNTGAAFRQFKREKFGRAPAFHYRPQPIDPTLLQRQLYNIPVERVEDPALQRIFRQKQEELDLKITMLRDRDTPQFLFESLQLFGRISDSLLALAEELLKRVPRTRAPGPSGSLNAAAFAARAEQEFRYYRDRCPEFKARTKVASDVSGLIVSRGTLMINSETSIPISRVEALMSHEVGTHLLTYYNGRLQPFKQLFSGLAGYEELQEGLAVLTEYLVGGLSRSRVRQLAARVVAARRMSEGATFVEVFRLLDRTYEFSQKQAYQITMRVFRGGGLTKDAVYLRGLRSILDYLQQGGELAPLMIGKIAVEHIPIIQELEYRKVIAPAAIEPRYMSDPEAMGRLEAVRKPGVTVLDLIDAK